jgi:predicted DNA-binding transcriptional regulator AlpA
MSKEQNENAEFLNSKGLRQRYGGVSQMWIHRRLLNDPRFPRPSLIGKRRYWKISDLTNYERALATK